MNLIINRGQVVLAKEAMFICHCLNISQEKQRIKRQQQNKKIELSDLKSGEFYL